MAPFMVGDFIQYIGFKTSSNEVVCYSIVVMNVQITTTRAPTYIRVEEALIGVYSSNTNAEIAETRVSEWMNSCDKDSLWVTCQTQPQLCLSMPST
jgi:hypothetical protein